MVIITSCNFEDADESSSGGGLFKNHQKVENAFSITLPSNGIYTENQNLDFVATHPYEITVTGTPQITIDVGGNSYTADYLTGSGTKNITFRYTVLATHEDDDGIDLTSSIDLSGGTLQFTLEGVPTDAELAVSDAGSTSGIKVDAVQPTISLQTPPAINTYYLNDDLNFLVAFDENIVVTGTPQITLDVGGAALTADYVSGSGSMVLVFRYQVGPTDSDLDGIVASSPLVLNSGSIKDIAGNDAVLIFTPTPMLTTFVDGNSPYIETITYPTNQTYLLGQTITLDLEYSEVVNVVGIPSVELDIDGDIVDATYTSGSGTDTLSFNFIVTQGLYDANGLEIQDTVKLNGGTIQDGTLANANATISPSLTPGILVDSRLPEVIGITAIANNDYPTGSSIYFDFEFNEAVIVTNTPRVQVNLDTGNVFADYISGSGSAVLRFQYTIQPGDQDNNGISFSSTFLDLNTTGSLIGVITANNADLSFSGFEPVLTDILVNNSPPTQLAITTQPVDYYNNYTMIPAITVEVRDASDVLVTAAVNDITIAFSADPSAGSANLSGTLTVAAVDGIATFSDLDIDFNATGYSFIVTSGGLTAATSNTFDITDAPPTDLVITNQPNDALAGASIAPSITVELRDFSDNLVTSSTDNVTLSFGADPSAGSATLSGTVTVAAIGGIATFNDININKAFSGYTLTASAVGVNSTTSNTFNISPNVKTQIVIITEPTNTIYSTAITPAIDVEIQDAYGNKTTDTDTITLAMGTDPSAGSAILTGTLPVAAVNGAASFSDIAIDTVGSSYTLTASAAGLTTATTTNFDIEPGAATQIIITTQPTDQFAGQIITPSITAEIRDAANNLVTTATDTVTLAFGTDPSAGSAIMAGVISKSAVAGIVTFDDIEIDLPNIGYSFDLGASGLTNAISNTFDINPNLPTQVIFTQSPSDTLAGAANSSIITIEIRDSFNDIVSTATDEVTLSFAADPSGATASLGGTLTVNAVAGIATFNDITVDKAFNAYTLDAASIGLTADISTAFNISPAAKSQLVFIIEPSHADYGESIAPNIEVEIQDAFGNITSDTDAITLAINNNPSAGILAGTLTQAAVAGVATFNDINIDSIGVGYTLDATATGLTLATSTSFDIGATATQLAITTQPTNAFNDYAISPSITVEVRDSNNNLVVAATPNITLSLGTDPSAGSATLSGTITQPAIGGIATFNDISIDTLATGYTFTTASTGLTADTSMIFDIIQAPATKLTFIQDPSDAVAGVANSPSITVEVRDANDNIVPLATDLITLALGSDPSGATASLGGTISVNAIAGMATFTDITIDKAFTGYDLTASATGLTLDTSSAFNITPGSKAQLAIKTQPTNAEYGVNISPSIEVAIQDAFGNKTADTDNITLVINNNPSAGTLSGTAVQAAIAGTATFSDIQIDQVGVGYTLEATATGVILATTDAFDIIAVPTQLAITQEPSNTDNDVSISPAITVEIRDSSNNLVVGSTASVTVALNANPGGSTISGTTTVSAIGGIATFNDLTLDQVATGYTLDFTSTGLTSTTSTTFDITQAPATQLAFIQNPSNTVAGVVNSPDITVELQDSNGTIVPTATDSITLAFGTDPSGSTATLGGTVTVNAIAGVATFTNITVDKAFNAYTFDVTGAGLTTATSTTFNITPAPKAKLAIKTEPIDTEQNVSISPSIEVEIQDSFGNKTTDGDLITLTISTNPGGSTLAGNTAQNAIAGTATFNDISLANVGTGYTLSATAAGLTLTTTAAFNILSTPVQLAITTQPVNTGNSITMPNIVVEIRDASNNLVTDSSANVTIGINTNPGASTLSGTTTIAAVGGIATFSDLSLNQIASGYSLVLTSIGLIGTVSSSFDIIQAPATKLVFTNNPSNANLGSVNAPNITVELRDINDNLVTTATESVTLSIGTDPSAATATLGGTLTVNAIAGIATFNDVTIDKAFSGYTLNATSGSLTGATSTPFDIFGSTLVFDSLATVNFGSISLGNSADATLLLNHTGGSIGSITETTLTAPFSFKGGSYPGVGGTCSTTITGNCTIVLTYLPTLAITSTGTVTINYNGSETSTRSLTAIGFSTAPTQLLVTGPTSSLVNNCIAYSLQSADSSNNLANVSSDETVSLLLNNGTGNFYSDIGCSSIITSSIISNGSSSKTIYFKSTVSGQSLTLIFNGTSLLNTSKNVNTSIDPSFISINSPNEIVTNTCSMAEISLVDINGVKTGASTAKTINFSVNGDALVYTDAFCTNHVTSLSFSSYQGSKNIYLTNATAEAVTFNFSDAAAVLTADSKNVNFVSALSWADTNYSKRVRIAINNLDISDTFSNMPVLIKIDNSKVDYADMQANGDDMRFYLDDHATALSYSIDTWNTSGISYIWVKVDTVPANSELNIYMYYKNTGSTNAESAITTWAAYEGVWLMNKSGTTYIDETANARNGIANGALTDASGPVGNALNFDGASTLKLTYDLSQVLGGTSTISFWMKTSQTGSNTDWQAPGLVGLSGATANQDLFYSFINASGNMGSSAGGGAAVQSNFVVNDNTWRYVTVSRNSTTGEFKFYINGVLNGSGNSGAGLKTQSFFDFGATTKLWGGGGFIFYEGSMDSIRMSSSIQSDNRIKAEYKFTTDTHVQISTPENL